METQQPGTHVPVYVPANKYNFTKKVLYIFCINAYEKLNEYKFRNQKYECFEKLKFQQSQPVFWYIKYILIYVKMFTDTKIYILTKNFYISKEKRFVSMEFNLAFC